jgi:aldose 1-epimerase
MEVLTTQPGVQFYTANYLDGSSACGGFQTHEAFCLETQHFPDSPNQVSFPNVILRPGAVFRETTVYRFGINGKT